MSKGKVIVGMSGGVDSSVAALVLRNEGYEVIGVTYDFWHDDDRAEDIYKNLSDAADAKAVADKLGIYHEAVNYTKQFKKNVEEYFVAEYMAGRTPNPCVRCNPTVKWAAMMESAKKHGADYVATGHYARIDKLENGRYAIKNSVTAKKDQTYVLYGLTQEQLSHTLMPIGDYEKDYVRKLADKEGLPVANKPDSQEICFVDDDDYAKYIENKTGTVSKPGFFVSSTGEVIGRHKGITHYTIGQRRGLEIAAGHRVFVTDINTESNTVVIGENEELFTDTVYANDMHYMSVEAPKVGFKKRVKAKIRYNHLGEFATMEVLPGNRLVVRFENKVRAATPGQSLVLYDGDYVLGGGIIGR
ncbi:MAG: tRNA 2-thiouridine(34) synthase MnmA [Lachnospiraceae bacterium]|nr:tRNA 2-thiouridine(34) synthase MnmA [Lachnospiraceae bacterium]